MRFTTSENARAVLLPAFDNTTLSDSTKRFLDQGGIAILLGESRSEYVAREMSSERRQHETLDSIRAVTEEARLRSGRLLVAMDQEMGGTCRLHDLVPQFPARHELAGTSSAEIEDIAYRIALAAASANVNMFLSPVLDVLTGPNPWLEGRTWSDDPEVVARLSAAYVRGVQRGGVAATGKHFPGFSTTTGDPAVDRLAVNPLSLADVEAMHAPFRAVIDANVEVILVGPAIVTAYDAQRPSLRSSITVSKLRDALGFKGLVMADDLDSKATMLGDSVVEVAIDALNAGCEFLLLADIGTQLEDVAEGIVSAAQSGRIDVDALASAAERVRALSDRYAPNSSDFPVANPPVAIIAPSR
ncbi:MAG: beta-N-acetylhexosaminidase [Devosia sp.]|uniref:glycoside hydrolase family 3 N-terminal domain-containing protein n=1 Tax=Devosia sp. TaxID=1871048 RepID=UPI00260DD1A6|nr:glycoside hydrolase family 3 N-terminal domain-containing protein [Devosia sp.]MDB5531071.1 beta-N-acetylhexosaminidase [Devosia sp.]